MLEMKTNLVVLQKNKRHEKVVFSNFFDKTATIKYYSVSDRYSFGIGISQYIGIGRYIGLADMGKAYQYRLSVSADKEGHIGWLTDIL